LDGRGHSGDKCGVAVDSVHDRFLSNPAWTLWETQPEEMAAAVARLDGTLCDVVAKHSGVRPVEQGEGDSFVVAAA